MKYLWLDVLLAFLIYQLSIYIYDHTTPEHYLIQEVETFNEDVKNERVLRDYHISKETHPNKIANTIEDVSDLSRQTIEMAVDLAMGILSGFD